MLVIIVSFGALQIKKQNANQNNNSRILDLDSHHVSKAFYILYFFYIIIFIKIQHYLKLKFIVYINTLFIILRLLIIQ